MSGSDSGGYCDSSCHWRWTEKYFSRAALVGEQTTGVKHPSPEDENRKKRTGYMGKIKKILPIFSSIYAGSRKCSKLTLYKIYPAVV